MSLGFVAWLAIIVVGALAWSALSWSLLQARLRRNRDGRCAKCSAVLDESRARVGGLLLCANCARKSKRAGAVAVRALALILFVGSGIMFWAVSRVWPTNRDGARLLLGLWALYSGILVFLAVMSARDAREAARRVETAEHPTREV